MSNSLNSDGFLSAEEENKDTGEIHRLLPNSVSSIQPIALLRLGIFVPTVRSSDRDDFGTDASDLTLKFAHKEGYTDIRVTGKRLDIETDFKVWVGIVSTLFDNRPDDNGYVSVKFGDFIERCGYPKKRLSLKFRKLIEDSLFRLTSTTLKFSRKRQDDRLDSHILHLVEAAKFKPDDDTVNLKPTPELRELYGKDYKKILKFRVLNALGRKETAKALYMYLEGLPENPWPISMDRMRDRLNLSSATNVQNSLVRKALKELQTIGYLEYTENKKGHKIEFKIHKRNPELIVTPDELYHPSDEDDSEEG